MNGNPPVPASPGGRSHTPTVIGAGCAQILLPGKGKRSDHRPHHAEHLGNVGPEMLATGWSLIGGGRTAMCNDAQ